LAEVNAVCDGDGLTTIPFEDKLDIAGWFRPLPIFAVSPPPIIKPRLP